MITHETLHYLGLTGTYRGYHQLYTAIQLACQDPERLLHVIRDLYEPVAKLCNCSVYCVERNIRTMILRVWKYNREQLFDVAGIELSVPPTVSEFIDFIGTYVLMQVENKK